MGRGLRLFIVALLLIGAAMAAAQWLVPSMITTTLQRIMAEQYEELGPVTVHVRTFPVVRLLWGHVDEMTIDVARPRWRELSWSGMTVYGESLRFNRRALWSGALELAGAQRFAVELTVSEADLEQYLHATVDELSQVQVTLTPGTVLLEGEAIVLSRRVRFQSEGTVVLCQDPAGPLLQYVPAQLTIADERLPDLLLALLGPLLQQTIDFSSLPVMLTLERVTIHDGFAVLHGTMLPQ